MFELFRRNRPTATPPGESLPQRTARRSSGLAEVHKLLADREALTILDLGSTSPQNIRYITELGHRVYSEDVLLASFDPRFLKPQAQGAPCIVAPEFLSENLKYSAGLFDAVFLWDVPDYLPESVVVPMVERLAEITKPGGVLLGFFHTKDAGADAPFYRYHITAKDAMELQRGPQFQLQRVFNNRHIENLFKRFSSIKFFLARDNVREVLVVR